RATSTTATFGYVLMVRQETLPAATPETEPNEDGTPSTGGGSTVGNDFSIVNANGPFSVDTVMSAAITPAGDEDVYSITNLGTTTAIVLVETYQTTWATCTNDTVLHVKNAAGADFVTGYLSDDDGAGFCSFMAVSVPPGTTVYAQAFAYGDAGTITAYNLDIS